MDSTALEKLINYEFKDKTLLEQCLTHPSLSVKKHNYEQLEFLGDAVLNFVITEYLFKEYSKLDEGGLAKKRSYLVSGHLTSEIARSIGIGPFILMSNSEQKSGGADNDANLENVTEALIGSIYIDGGIVAVREFILFFWADYLHQEFSEKDLNPKSFLQEWALERGHILPHYSLVSQSGPAHMPIFEIEVMVQNFASSTGTGRSKKEAEIDAAKNLIKRINND